MWVLSLAGDPSPVPLLQSRFREDHPVLSPDGRFLAYSSNESGERSVFVRRFPDLGDKQRVGSGWSPKWSADGNRLLYVSPEGVREVPVATNPALDLGTTRLLLEGTFATRSHALHSLPDDGFIALELVGSQEIIVVLNYLEELKRITPAD